MTLKKTVVVIPSDSLSSYLKLGMSENEIKEYFNPENMYEEVYVVSSYEKGIYQKFGMTIIGASIFNARKIIEKISPDIVRAYDGFYASDYACANRVKGVPVICSVHDKRKELIHYSLRYADGIICISQAVKEAVVEKVKGLDLNKIKIINNCLDTSLFHHIEENELFHKLNTRFPTKYHILHVGRKAEEKNIDTMIKALSYLSDDYSVIFVGQGDFSPYCQLAEELNVKNKCFNIERISHDELPVWYSWCTCMCTPSRTEGFGFVFIEAASCGCAIITSDIMPMNEYLENDKTACLIKEYENPRMLANAIKKVCEDHEYSCALKEGAVKVGEKFTKEKINKMNYEFIKNIQVDKKNENNINRTRKRIIFKHIKRVYGTKFKYFCENIII